MRRNSVIADLVGHATRVARGATVERSQSGDEQADDQSKFFHFRSSLVLQINSCGISAAQLRATQCGCCAMVCTRARRAQVCTNRSRQNQTEYKGNEKLFHIECIKG